MTEFVRVLFYRPRGWWNQRRRYTVWIDHRPVCRLRRGQGCEVPVPVGRHLIRACVAATGSVPIEFDVRTAREPINVRIEYAGKIFFFGALWRGFTVRRWLTIAPDLTPERAVVEGVRGQVLPIQGIDTLR